MLTIESAGVTEVDVFECHREFEPRLCEPSGQGAVLLPGPLLVDQQSEAFLEAEVGDVGVFLLLLKGVGHAVESRPTSPCTSVRRVCRSVSSGDLLGDG